MYLLSLCSSGLKYIICVCCHPISLCLRSQNKYKLENKPDIQLKLPINRSNVDVGCDQGYGSERSPEDEFPPPLPMLAIPYQMLHQQPTSAQLNYEKYNGCEYSFITQGKDIRENSFKYFCIYFYVHIYI